MLSTSKGATGRNLQTRPKIIIKWPEYQIENFPDKSLFITLKAKMSSKSVFNLMKFAGLTKNPKKKYRNTKSFNQNEIFRKKVYLIP
jgi:hypothetical protein